MTLGSLRLRLLVAWAILIVLTIVFSALSLRKLYERGITRRSISDLQIDISELVDRLAISSKGKLLLRYYPTDPQFHIPFGGRYWQIFSNGKLVLSSRSMQGNVFKLDLGNKATHGAVHLDLKGPRSQDILALARNVEITDKTKTIGKVVIVAGVNKIEIKEDTEEFASDIIQGLIGVALFLMLAGWVHVTIGLSPLKKVKTVLAAVRAGHLTRITENFPDEVMPLIDETNSLLDEQDAAIAAARLRASKLAHDLKTPLSILAAQSRSLRKSGAIEPADQIDRQVELLRRNVERELALVKARGTSKTRLNRLDACLALRELGGALQKLPESDGLEWVYDMPNSAHVNVDLIDFNNIMGNLLDNACKWARSKLVIKLRQLPVSLMITVEDDGGGITEDQIARLLMPGERDAPDVAGTGLGLAIVKDLVDIYGGQLDITCSKMGGASVSVQLPIGVAR